MDAPSRKSNDSSAAGSADGDPPAPQYVPEHEWVLSWARRHPAATRWTGFGLLAAVILGVVVWLAGRHLVAPPRDREPPSVVLVRPPVNPRHLVISFSEPLRIDTAEDPQAYEITGANPLSAVLDGPATNVLLTLADPLQFGTTNTLTLQGISDQAPVPNVMARTSLVVKTLVLTRGFLRADYYLNMTWHKVDALTENPAFPDLYDATFYRTNSTSPSNVGDNYGLRLWGFFIPPTNGNYTVYVRSDDESDVYLSSDANPENKTLVASQTGSGRHYDSNDGHPRFSTMTGLVAGQMYYFEALLKEGGGEDYLTVVFKAEDEPPPVHKTRSVTPIPGSALACYAEPDGIKPMVVLRLDRRAPETEPP